MKKVILIVFLLPCLAYGQVMENFEHGRIVHWDQYPSGRWSADTSESLSGAFSLHHTFDNADAGTDQAGILIDSLHPSDGTVRWSFLIRHGCDPSSSNSWSVILMTDSGPESILPNGKSRGFAIGVNLTGYDDTLRLWKITGTMVSVVVNTGINWQTDIGTTSFARISVERNAAGLWMVSVTQAGVGEIVVSQGYDSELFPCEWLVVSYKYTSSRDRLLWFDDLAIEGIFYPDNSPPVITGIQVYDAFSVQITLSDQPSVGFSAAANFLLDPGGINPVSVVSEDAVYTLTFKNELADKLDYILWVNELCSKDNFCSENLRLPFTCSRPGRGDVIISEIMADPEPAVSLPATEYIELTNRADIPLTLNGWLLSTGETDYQLPEINIQPGEYIIVCPARDTSSFRPFGQVKGMKQFPALTDNGRLLLLYDGNGTLIHGVEYSAGWYNSELKSKGGWSLEMVDKDYPFYDLGNWTASVSVMGGTPGSQNSVAGKNPDTRFAGDLIIFPVDSMDISVVSPEPLFSFPGMADSILIDGDCPAEISISDPLMRTFTIKLNDPLKRRNIYQLAINGLLRDFAGNLPARNRFEISLAEPAQHGDVLFNELLFNPLPGDPDYIELYNTSANNRCVEAGNCNGQ